ncbi:MAG TPA: hypothetical protein VLW53_17315, partial [Candidatus Eisenbacteria bacterium]|nr:hypothetical protein [Candidatus Eisenbacteria bacterium]
MLRRRVLRPRDDVAALGVRRLRVTGGAETARCTFRCSERSVRSAEPFALVEPPALSRASC